MFRLLAMRRGQIVRILIFRCRFCAKQIVGCLLIAYAKQNGVKYFGTYLAIMGGQCKSSRWQKRDKD